MELELGLKLTSMADEFASDFQIAKDRASPVFVSRETDTMFFLTAHLKGYKRRNIKIDINEDGSLIVISGEKQVQETVIVGWKVYKKEREIKGFKKVFRIPTGVILDKIKAKFNDEESALTITMPKTVKGVRGTTIEEVKDKPELVRAGSGSLQITDETSPKAGTSNPEMAETSKAIIGEDEQKPPSVHDLKDGEGEAGQQASPSIIHGEVARVEAGTCKEDEEKHENADEIEEITEPKKHEDTYKQVSDERSGEEKVGPSGIEPSEEASEGKQEDEEKYENAGDREEITEPKKHENTYKQVSDERSGEEKVGPSGIEPSEEASEGKQDDEEKSQRFKLCMPLVAGSTLLLTFVVFVIQMIRSKHQTCRRRD